MAISPQKAELNAEVKQKQQLKYTVLTDADNSVAKAMGLVYTLSAELAELYGSFGINLPQNHGTETWQVPLATRMVVGQDRVILAIDADPDYTVRPEPEETLAVLLSNSS